jgi:hypothetical protein
MKKRKGPIVKRASDDVKLPSRKLAEAPPAPLNIFIAMPAGNFVPAKFMYDLAKMVGFTTMTLVNDHIADLSINMVEGTYVHMARQDLLVQAVKVGATHVMWLDTDHQFPPNLLVRLLAHNKDMVGINYPTRKQPVRFVAFEHVKGHPDDEESRVLMTGPDSVGLEKVDALGFGAVLMKTPPLDDLPNPLEHGPWFDIVWEQELDRWKGEDVFFCELWRNAGYEIHVDHELSKACKHVGLWEYTTDHAFAWQEEFSEEAEGDGDNEL